MTAEWWTYSAQETEALGYKLGTELAGDSIICFFGEVGAGKTTFIKGLIKGAAKVNSEEVNSPTFIYLNIHKGPKTVYHFDLYRLVNEEEFLSMGFDEFFYAGGICCIEWSEKILSLLPSNSIKLTFEHTGENIRKIKATYPEKGS